MADATPATDVPTFFAQVRELIQETGAASVHLICSPADGSEVNLTVIGRTSSEDEDEPFQPIRLTATPAELDDPAQGLAAYVEEMAGRRKTLAELRADADAAQEKAEEAEKRRKEKADAKRKENTENGPLFGEDD